MKRLICLLVVACMAVVMMPTFHVTALDNDTEESQRQINEGNLYIDDNPAGGYYGDYVVIYNPSTSPYSSASTGNMSGLILADTGTTNVQDFEPVNPDIPYKIDVDQSLSNEKLDKSDFPEVEGDKTLSFEVGDTHNFILYSTYCPLPSTNVEFECLAVGENCYIWSPTSTASNVYPLDEINPSYAAICAAEFDSKFDLMNSSFGDHYNGSQGDGKLNILYYNIDDGWTLGQGYVAGFFTASDFTNNSMPCLNIDTYPGVYY